jgi:hypothetical protein
VAEHGSFSPAAEGVVHPVSTGTSDGTRGLTRRRRHGLSSLAGDSAGHPRPGSRLPSVRSGHQRINRHVGRGDGEGRGRDRAGLGRARAHRRAHCDAIEPDCDTTRSYRDTLEPDRDAISTARDAIARRGRPSARRATFTSANAAAAGVIASASLVIAPPRRRAATASRANRLIR